MKKEVYSFVRRRKEQFFREPVLKLFSLGATCVKRVFRGIPLLLGSRISALTSPRLLLYSFVLMWLPPFRPFNSSRSPPTLPPAASTSTTSSSSSTTTTRETRKTTSTGSAEPDGTAEVERPSPSSPGGTPRKPLILFRFVSRV